MVHKPFLDCHNWLLNQLHRGSNSNKRRTSNERGEPHSDATNKKSSVERVLICAINDDIEKTE